MTQPRETSLTKSSKKRESERPQRVNPLQCLLWRGEASEQACDLERKRGVLMQPEGDRLRVESPCVKICALREGECLGCGRRVDEIQGVAIRL